MLPTQICWYQTVQPGPELGGAARGRMKITRPLTFSCVCVVRSQELGRSFPAAAVRCLLSWKATGWPVLAANITNLLPTARTLGIWIQDTRCCTASNVPGRGTQHPVSVRSHFVSLNSDSVYRELESRRAAPTQTGDKCCDYITRAATT